MALSYMVSLLHDPRYGPNILMGIQKSDLVMFLFLSIISAHVEYTYFDVPYGLVTTRYPGANKAKLK